MIDKAFPLILIWNSFQGQANFAKVDETWLWNSMFGHVNMGSLRLMHSKEMTIDLPAISQ